MFDVPPLGKVRMGNVVTRYGGSQDFRGRCAWAGKEISEEREAPDWVFSVGFLKGIF